jgi:4-amino-4-deoxy-L-arabinose transferase-like glycosyltransferase
MAEAGRSIRAIAEAPQPNGRPVARWAVVTPERAVVIGSLLLSLFALTQSPSIGRDGMFYLHVAELIQHGAWRAAVEQFNWVLWPALIALLSSITTLSLETSAQTMSIVLLAGVCLMAVRLSAAVFPGSAWHAAVVTLAVPALNQYRGGILREFGAWFFALLAVWMFLRWKERPEFRTALLFQVSVLLAALFRMELLIVLPAALIHLALSAEHRRLLWRGASLVWLPAAGIGAFLLVFGLRDGVFHGRAEFYLIGIDPWFVMSRFALASEQLANEVLPPLAQNYANAILFWGLMAMLVIRFIEVLSVLVVPFAVAATTAGSWRRLGPIWVLAALFVGILVSFVLWRHFVTSRYVATLAILLIPLVAAGLAELDARVRRKGWRAVLIALLAILALSNVITTSEGRPHHEAAAAWLRVNVEDPAAVYVPDARIAFAAGWGYALPPQWPEGELFPYLADHHRWIVVERPLDDPELTAWIANEQAEVEAQFSRSDGRTVWIIRRPNAGSGRARAGASGTAGQDTP